MKRFWIGLALLLSLLLGGILISKHLCQSFSPMASRMACAAQAAREEDWPQARALTCQAREQWRSRWAFTAVFFDHTPMEQIDALFSRLEIYGAEQQSTIYAALCAQLAQAFTDLGDDHIFTWWNFL